MEIKHLLEIRSILSGIGALGATETRYRMGKFIIDTNYNEKFYREETQKIIDEFADKNEDGTTNTDENGNIHIKKDKADEFYHRVQQLDSMDVPCPDAFLTLSEIDPFSLSVSDLVILNPIIKEE